MNDLSEGSVVVRTVEQWPATKVVKKGGDQQKQECRFKACSLALNLMRSQRFKPLQSDSLILAVGEAASERRTGERAGACACAGADGVLDR